ncbi:dihydrofolate reductase [Polycladidibacter hongkongensis]|uniref:dihydrofolate reductase n=1 Tax=Polycladidibacter hongkongensis TaxID=1647556 RepID=UPI00082D3CD4|nr:dihydrofolate reductase [Pseudovibrio hongkongensis]
MRPVISLIAAVAENGVIGFQNDMPWSISTDLKFFRKTTMGKPIIMGRRTFASIGRALPGRRNIVVSRGLSEAPEGAELAGSLAQALEMASKGGQEAPHEIMVIGGGQLYAEAIAQAQRLYITRVKATPEGDTFFPQIDTKLWQLVKREAFERGAKDSASTELELYERCGGD